MDKRGIDISMNILIVAIIAILVLAVVAIVFTGGIANVVQKVKEFFTGSTSGTTLDFVRDQCNLACETAKLSSNPSKSRFCTAEFNVREGKEDKIYSCAKDGTSTDGKSITSLKIECPGVTPCI